MAKKKKIAGEGVDLDMTPMIDVVFQLIIFFVVTLKTADTINPDIVLEYGKNGPILKKDELKVPPVTIEVKRYTAPTKWLADNGWSLGPVISVNGAKTSESQLTALLRNIVAHRGKNVPILIRADKDARHEDVRKVMNICASVGIWQVSFLAMVTPGDSAK